MNEAIASLIMNNNYVISLRYLVCVCLSILFFLLDRRILIVPRNNIVLYMRSTAILEKSESVFFVKFYYSEPICEITIVQLQFYIYYCITTYTTVYA